VLCKIGCPGKFVNIDESFNEGMQDQVIDGGELLHVRSHQWNQARLCSSFVAIQHIILHDAVDSI